MMHNGFWSELKVLRAGRFVDLTHAFHPGIPHGYGFDDEVRTALFHHEPGLGSKGDGFLVHRYEIVGQWGTHVDPPVHFVNGGRYLHEIDVREMILPLVVIDCSRQAADDPDYQITLEDIDVWERRYGLIPDHAFVAMRTDWSHRWPNPEEMRPSDEEGSLHFPGWTIEVLKFLSEVRNVCAIGHETSDTDPGKVAGLGKFPAEAYWLGQDRYQIELLKNLDQVPEKGGIVIAAFPNVFEGSGFPVRAIAIVPQDAVPGDVA